MERKIDIAIARGFDVGYDDHNLPTMYGEFEYETIGIQGLGVVIDINFVTEFCKAFGVMKLQDCNGKIVKVEHDDRYIYKIIPLRFNKGKVFNIEEWSNDIEKKLKKGCD